MSHCDISNARFRAEWEVRYASHWRVIGKAHYPKKPVPAPVRGPRVLPESNESVRALRAIQTQIDALTGATVRDPHT